MLSRWAQQSWWWELYCQQHRLKQGIAGPLGAAPATAVALRFFALPHVFMPALSTGAEPSPDPYADTFPAVTFSVGAIFGALNDIDSRLEPTVILCRVEVDTLPFTVACSAFSVFTGALPPLRWGALTVWLF